MKRYIQYDAFNIYSFEEETWPHPMHKHTYFEIIFIREGCGKHLINDNAFTYKKGDVFLLGPEDYHLFEIASKTSFTFIRFSESFVTGSSVGSGKGWTDMIGMLLNSPYQSGGSVIRTEEDKKQLYHLLEVLLYEYSNRHEYTYGLIMDHLLKVILSIIARNLSRQNHLVSSKSSRIVEEILLYIRQHIYTPEKLRMEVIATQFCFSKNYLSIFFKNQTGESLQQYILKYKLRQVENRLHYSNLTLSQIAHEFGFSDISHFSKIFRKYYGMSPKDFRGSIA
ncbi:AraC family transcriptional regulator [Pontibacter sp. SGAir0037]|uniref:AraC family transcriptional regulator n=1 Tax=Pontibacter sp. SGAir0037 TaxID=2571030 RepID=UPI0010CCDA7C|nr:AraC family transcriptional regulator [Pontibacter sp. SGAir0037]QCR22069.1 AraC family transcriptional regulator [Pontibacter sp. SGAir0037]